MGDVALSLADERTALALLGTPRPGNRTLEIAMRQQLAGAMGKNGETAGAITQMEGAIAELQAMGRIRTIGAQTLFNNLGVLFVRAGLPLRALEAFDRAIEVNGSLPEGDESTPALSANLAKVLVDLGRVPEARQALQHFLSTAADRGDTRSVPFGVSAFAWCAPGELEQCDQRLETSRQQLEAVLPPGHPSLAAPDVSYARMALAQGRPELAKPRVVQALALYGPAEPGYPERVRALTLLARAELALGDTAGAQRDADHAVVAARAVSTGFEHTAWLGEALLVQGETLRQRGDPSATTVLRRAAIELDASAGEGSPGSREARTLLGS
jgi:tetratricopeptide (TPR) repeat protein